LKLYLCLAMSGQAAQSAALAAVFRGGAAAVAANQAGSACTLDGLIGYSFSIFDIAISTEAHYDEGANKDGEALIQAAASPSRTELNARYAYTSSILLRASDDRRKEKLMYVVVSAVDSEPSAFELLGGRTHTPRIGLFKGQWELDALARHVRAKIPVILIASLEGDSLLFGA
jgi:hypothetical protein